MQKYWRTSFNFLYYLGKNKLGLGFLVIKFIYWGGEITIHMQKFRGFPVLFLTSALFIQKKRGKKICLISVTFKGT